MTPFAARRRGQTLVEVLVATVVLGVGLVAVMEAFSVCTAAVGIIRGRTVARNFAARMLSDMRADPALLTSDEEGDLGDEYPGFTWQRQLRETPRAGIVAVRVTVAWKSRGVSREYVIESLLKTPRA